MKENRLPDAIGIGTQRCATSWLNRVLLAHPQIGKPDRGLHFFSREFDRGRGWYKEQLSPHADRRVLVEFSVSYTYHEHYQDAAKRIYDHVPKARLFPTVRNPIERAFSEYRRGVSRGEIPPKLPFQKAAQQFPYIVERGLYGRTIEEYRRYFPPQRILVMCFDDLEVDARAYTRRLFDYLEVDPSMGTQEYGRRSSSPVSPRPPILAIGMYGLKNTIDRCMDALGLATAWRRFKRKHI